MNGSLDGIPLAFIMYGFLTPEGLVGGGPHMCQIGLLYRRGAFRGYVIMEIRISTVNPSIK